MTKCITLKCNIWVSKEDVRKAINKKLTWRVLISEEGRFSGLKFTLSDVTSFQLDDLSGLKKIIFKPGLKKIYHHCPFRLSNFHFTTVSQFLSMNLGLVIKPTNSMSNYFLYFTFSLSICKSF